MLTTFFKPTEYLDHHIPSNRGTPPWQRPLSLLNFITDRTRKVRVRLIVQLVASVFFVLACVRLAGYRFGHATFALGSVFSWHKDGHSESGDLRIVVFGSQDVTGSATQRNNDSRSWTQHMCAELGCTSLLSFVPLSDEEPGLTSNMAFDDELERLSRADHEDDSRSGTSSLNYSFVQKQYLLPSRTADLEAQVRQFLSMPVPSKAPRQTLWILSLGTWDIWNLAALPMGRGEAAVRKAVEHVFDQVEVLYEESLKPDSVAFSDYYANMTESQFKAITAPEEMVKQDPRSLESFRLLIPHLFDITMTPGWHSRPVPPPPHSAAEQMRNAVYLTEKWNDQVTMRMIEWAEQGMGKPKGTQKRALPVRDEEAERLEGGYQENASESPKTLVAPYPLRLGHGPDPSKLILNAMMEVEMNRTVPEANLGSMSFENIRTPCLGKEKAESEEKEAWSANGDDRGECDMPDDHLFYDLFTIGERAMEEVAKWTAVEVKSKLLPP